MMIEDMLAMCLSPIRMTKVNLQERLSATRWSWFESAFCTWERITTTRCIISNLSWLVHWKAYAIGAFAYSTFAFDLVVLKEIFGYMLTQIDVNVYTTKLYMYIESLNNFLCCRTFGFYLHIKIVDRAWLGWPYNCRHIAYFAWTVKYDKWKMRIFWC